MSRVLDQIRELRFHKLDNTLTTQLVPQDMRFVTPADLSGPRLETLVQSLILFVDETPPEIDVLPLVSPDQAVEPMQLIGDVFDV